MDKRTLGLQGYTLVDMCTLGGRGQPSVFEGIPVKYIWGIHGPLWPALQKSILAQFQIQENVFDCLGLLCL